MAAVLANNLNVTHVSLEEIPQETLKAHQQAVDMLIGSESTADSKLSGLRYFRRFLSKPSISNFDIATVLAVDILELLKPFLAEAMAAFPEQTFEALWIVTNLAAGNTEHCKTILDSGLVDNLVKLLDVEKYTIDVVDQCIWAFGNIVGDGAVARDKILYETDVLAKIVPMCNSSNFSVRRNVSWTISNFFRFKPRPAVELAVSVIPAVVDALRRETDEEALIDLCWAVSYLSEDNDSGYPRIQALLDNQVAGILMQHLNSNNHRLRVPCVRSLGNLITGTDVQTDAVLEAGLIGAMHPLLQSHNSNMRKEICWIISNIMAGTTSQKMQVLKSINAAGVRILETLVEMLKVDSAEVCKEIWWVFGNASMGKELPFDKLIPELSIPALAQSIEKYPSNSKVSIAVIGIVQLLCFQDKDHLRADVQLWQLLEAENLFPQTCKLVQEKIQEISSSRTRLGVELNALELSKDINWIISAMIHTIE